MSMIQGTKEKIQNFTKLSRANTGSHPLDSGAVYGYHYERAVKKDVTIDIGHDNTYISGNIPLGLFLDSAYKIDIDATKRLQKIKGHELNSRDAAEVYAEAHNLNDEFKNGTWEYTYNYETDLDQDFQYYTMKDSKGDDLFFIETHNGADARGGFSNVVVAKQVSDYANDLRVRWCVTKAFEKGIENKELLEHYQLNDCQDDLNYILGKNIEIRWASKIDESTVKLILSNGNEIEIHAECPAISF